MDAKKLCRLSYAAQHTGVARSTLKSAIERGEIKSDTTVCGLPLVALGEVYRWVNKSHERKPGPKTG